MIDKLEIKNFMPFEELTIPTLKRINLIGGKNNAGKTALLEAIRIFRSREDSGGVISEILKSRKNFQNGQSSLRHLFNRKSFENNDSVLLKINDFSIYAEKSHYVNYQASLAKKEIGIRLSDIQKEDLVFIQFGSDFDLINELWGIIKLTPEEDDVNDVVRNTVESKLIRFDIDGNRKKVDVRLTDTKKPVSLQSLGDGVQRILLIALGLVNAQNSILLIDEIELGLHHSVMEKLWRMIFKYAKKWDIQVFATTHSQDAIRTFQYVALKEENKSEAQFIRLQVGRKGNNEAILYDTDKLSEVLEIPVEIR